MFLCVLLKDPRKNCACSCLGNKTKESNILLDKKYYSQIDGVAMGSPLGPTLANNFLCYHESSWRVRLTEIFETSLLQKICG